MGNVTLRRLLCVCLGLAATFLSGCSLSGTGGLTLFPSGHPLIDEAKAMRQQAPIPAAVPRELEKQVLLPYTVEPGDALLVQPLRLDSPVRFPGGDLTILQDGTINLGQYGMVNVAGKTIQEIEDIVTAAVKAKEKDKDVGPISVRLTARVSKVYYVQGEVNSPGSFPLAGRETVLDGIIAAGGLTGSAGREHIILVRPTHPGCPRVVLPVCWQEIVQLGDTSTNYQLAPGDRIYVPTRNCWDAFLHRPNNCKCNAQIAAPIPAGDTSCPHPPCPAPFAPAAAVPATMGVVTPMVVAPK